MIFCVDSNIIVWGIKKQATAGQEEMIPRAELIFSRADEYEDFILIPSMVVAEILAPEPPGVRARYLEVLKRSFIIAPFDERAALKYAEMLHNRFAEVRNLAASTGTSRQRMKVDHMIIATAIVNNANCIYTTDNGLKAFASGHIDIRDLPTIREELPAISVTQTNLFETINTESDEKEAEKASEPEPETQIPTETETGEVRPEAGDQGKL